MTDSFVFDFRETDHTQTALAGGKGANLGELTKIAGIRVPEGFIVSTAAFESVIAAAPAVGALMDGLSLLKADNQAEISHLSAQIRSIIEGITIPAGIAEEISRQLSRLGAGGAYAVRSSATAEDLPAASFAGQQDTYLNITGEAAILRHISRCWASLFTARAVTYRIRNGFGHRKVLLAVVVQQMVFPQSAGIMFTADPVTASRKVVSIDAGFGLGEALVAGLVNPDVYKVSDGAIIDKHIAVKKLATYALTDGGTEEAAVEPEKQHRQVLTDEQVLLLAHTGRIIATHFGQPQDIEWCLAEDGFYIVQSRPVTTLFPIPEADDRENRVYVSVGHQQMMTDPIKPLGLSFYQLITPAPIRKAGGRLFVDITHFLSSPAGRERLMNTLGKSDPLINDALKTIMAREHFIPQLPQETEVQPADKCKEAPPAPAPLGNDPAIASAMIQRFEESAAALKKHILTKSGPELFDFIIADIQELKTIMQHPHNMGMIMAAINAAFRINERIYEWLGEKNVADILSLSVSGNITSEMGLDLLALADLIRPYPGIIAYLQQVTDDNFLEALPQFAGGQQVREAIDNYLSRYGMRCAGEIDISRPRWSEKPFTLIPMILGNLRNAAPGAGKQKFEEGRQAARKKEAALTEQLQHLPDAGEKIKEVKENISLLRNYAGYREYPKYAIVSRYLIYKQALLKEAAQLVQLRAIQDTADVFYLTFEEFREAVRTGKADEQLIRRRKEEYTVYEKLTPPRLITSDGEIITGAYKRENLPADAIAGLPVSSGMVEGRARVILNMEDADLEEGDILVTTFTDPSWTPLFVTIKGLVTEVGGIMTHGAVIAREYGLPAVVCVENATRLIKDGQRIRVHGTEGYIELL
ncbi:phosphoenolpyruvate synthase [Chitinophaga sp. Mgbs1]|uniref:Prodigiosin synthesizing transferase PigC n=1 Tax=Chitinophaga solisilvae TaxID=1233460 RepID=A0A433WJ62_9BACT|nr:phosphoenolpyruvate synthase [Chitinophaga solisilvae]